MLLNVIKHFMTLELFENMQAMIKKKLNLEGESESKFIQQSAK